MDPLVGWVCGKGPFYESLKLSGLIQVRLARDVPILSLSKRMALA
jgi:hypothetical protein